jgi:KTSC domain
VLRVVFNSGAVWEYNGVPKKVYDELLASSSKGSYMRSSIIGVYPEGRIRRR